MANRRSRMVFVQQILVEIVKIKDKEASTINKASFV